MLFTSLVYEYAHNTITSIIIIVAATVLWYCRYGKYAFESSRRLGLLDTATYWRITPLEALGRMLASMQVAIVRLDRFIDLRITTVRVRTCVLVQLLSIVVLSYYMILLCTLLLYE